MHDCSKRLGEFVIMYLYHKISCLVTLLPNNGKVQQHRLQGQIHCDSHQKKKKLWQPIVLPLVIALLLRGEFYACLVGTISAISAVDW